MSKASYSVAGTRHPLFYHRPYSQVTIFIGHISIEVHSNICVCDNHVWDVRKSHINLDKVIVPPSYPLFICVPRLQVANV